MPVTPTQQRALTLFSLMADASCAGVDPGMVASAVLWRLAAEERFLTPAPQEPVHGVARWWKADAAPVEPVEMLAVDGKWVGACGLVNSWDEAAERWGRTPEEWDATMNQRFEAHSLDWVGARSLPKLSQAAGHLAQQVWRRARLPLTLLGPVTFAQRRTQELFALNPKTAASHVRVFAVAEQLVREGIDVRITLRMFRQNALSSSGVKVCVMALKVDDGWINAQGMFSCVDAALLQAGLALAHRLPTLHAPDRDFTFDPADPAALGEELIVQARAGAAQLRAWEKEQTLICAWHPASPSRCSPRM